MSWDLRLEDGLMAFHLEKHVQFCCDRNMSQSCQLVTFCACRSVGLWSVLGATFAASAPAPALRAWAYLPGLMPCPRVCLRAGSGSLGCGAMCPVRGRCFVGCAGVGVEV